jgi:tRNA(Ile)-lysidine synthase
MLEKLQRNIIQNKLFEAQDKLLLAVSGGVDSMVALDIMYRLGFNIAVAHVNYKMRGDESDLDQELVRSVCLTKGIPFHQTIFPEELKKNGNFQEQARDFRYNFFNALCAEFGYHKVITAHHAMDVIETFFINLFRGSGLLGLSSIPIVNKNIIRPFLIFHKNEFYDYANAYQVKYREDKSNRDDYYLRNFIRNNIVKSINEINPSNINGILHSINNIERSKNLLTELINQIINKDKLITYSFLDNLKDKSLFLYLALKHYGFNLQQMEDILSAQDLSAKVVSDTHTLLKDRLGYLLLENSYQNYKFEIIIDKEGDYSINENKISFTLVDEIGSQEQDTQVLCFDRYPFPLLVRSKRDGDFFRPSGMAGKKQSLKKYFTDHKFTFEQKQNSILILKDDKIISLYPYRISSEVEEQSSTKYLLSIKKASQ